MYTWRNVTIATITMIAFCVLSLFGGADVLAQDGNLGDAGSLLEEAGVGTGVETGTLSTVPGVVGIALQFAISLLGTIMFAYMVYAGYLWMTAQGDEGKISSAKNIMTNTVIGFIVVVSAYAITVVVQSRFR
jgi:hypothetical protein